MATLQLEGLTTRYGKIVALDDLQLDIGDGEFFVILGPSGAGKTTTLKTVAGLVERRPARSSSAAGRCGGRAVPPQRGHGVRELCALPAEDGVENLASPLRSGRTGTYSEQEQKDRIEQVTTTLGINHLLERFPRELSNGQRQRVALGRVLVRPADVYLLDEPLSHLDAKLRAAMRAELKQLGEMSNTTTLYVTHDYQEALALGDRMAVLRSGRLVQHGTPNEVWEQPVNTFVARALGQPEMNLLAGRRRRRIDEHRLGLARPAGATRRRRLRRRQAAGGSAAPGPRGRDRRAAGDCGRSRRQGDGHAGRAARPVDRAVRRRPGDTLIVVSGDHAPAEEGETITVAAPGDDVHVFAAGDGDDGLAPARIVRPPGAPAHEGAR